VDCWTLGNAWDGMAWLRWPRIEKQYLLRQAPKDLDPSTAIALDFRPCAPRCLVFCVMLVLDRRPNTLTSWFRPSSGIPGDWAPSAHRGQPDPQPLPHAHLRAQCGHCEVPLLVLPSRSPQGQEGHRRDRQRQRGMSRCIQERRCMECL
jgi:hypothetical protein